MITTTRRHYSTLRSLFHLSIPLITILMLLIGNVAFMAFHIPGISLISSAHAEATTEKTTTQEHVQTPCTFDPTEPHCNNQDPMAQECYKDAQTLSFHEIPDTQGAILATVQRRYSPTCRSEWGRIIASPDNHQPVSITIGTNESQATLGPIAFTTMVFVPNLSRASEIKGTVSTNGIPPDQADGAGLTVILPALPTPTK